MDYLGRYTLDECHSFMRAVGAEIRTAECSRDGWKVVLSYGGTTTSGWGGTPGHAVADAAREIISWQAGKGGAK